MSADLAASVKISSLFEPILPLDAKERLHGDTEQATRPRKCLTPAPAQTESAVAVSDGQDRLSKLERAACAPGKAVVVSLCGLR